MVLGIETSTQEAIATQSSATLVERDARERVSRVEVEKSAALAFAHEDVKGIVREMIHLEGELAEKRQAQEFVEENSCFMSDAACDHPPY
jgi:hypothetical protein